MENENKPDSDDEYEEEIDLSQNEFYNVGSLFFENEDGDNISTILTHLTKVHVTLVDTNLELLKEQKSNRIAMQNVVKMLQKINKNLVKDS